MNPDENIRDSEEDGSVATETLSVARSLGQGGIVPAPGTIQLIPHDVEVVPRPSEVNPEAINETILKGVTGATKMGAGVLQITPDLISDDTDLTLDEITHLIAQIHVVEDEGIVPDVIDKVPDEILQVSYPSGATVHIGEILTPTEVKDVPTVQWNADENAFYTLCLTDPDAPSRADPKFREWHHWLVVNIPGKDISKGEVLSEYIGSAPPKETGLHRYIFLVYKQAEMAKFDDEPRLTNTSITDRASFSIRFFAEKHHLGDPVGINFYFAEYDEYVTEIYKQLGVSE